MLSFFFSSLFLFSSHIIQLRHTNKWIYNHEGNGNVDTSKNVNGKWILIKTTKPVSQHDFQERTTQCNIFRHSLIFNEIHKQFDQFLYLTSVFYRLKSHTGPTFSKKRHKNVDCICSIGIFTCLQWISTK